MKKLQPLTASFLSLSLVMMNAPFSWAQSRITASPILVSPSQVKALQQEIIDQDRINRDEEIKVRALIAQRQNLTQDLALSNTAKAVNEALDQYSLAILERDRVRIMTNSQRVRVVGLNSYETDPVYVDALRGKKQALLDKYRDLTQLRDELAAINERLRDQDSHQDMLVVNYAKTIDALKAQLASQSQSNVAKLATFQGTLDAKNQQISQLRAENLRLTQKVDELSRSLSTATSQMQQQQTQGQSEAAQLKELTGRLLSNDEKIAYYDQAIAAKDAQIARLNSRLKDATETIASLKSSLEKLSTKITQHQDSAQDWEDTITQFKEKISAQVNQLKEKDAQIIDLADKISAMKQDMARVKEGQQDLIDRQKEKLADKDRELMLLKDKVAGFEGQENIISRQKEMIASQDKRLEELTSQWQEAKNSSLNEENSRKENWDMLSSLRQQVDSLKGDFEKKDEELARMEEMVVQLKETLKKKDSTIAAQEKDIAQLNKKLGEALDTVKTYQSRVSRVDELRAQVQELQRAISDQQKTETLLDETKEKLALSQQLITRQDEQIALLVHKGDLGHSRQEQLGNQIDAIAQRLDALMLARQEDKTEQQGKLESLRKQIQAHEDEKLSLKEELKNRIVEQARMADMLDIYQTKLKNKNEDYAASLNDLLALKKNQASLEKNVSDLTSQLALKEAEIKKVKDYFYELERRSSEKDAQLKANEVSAAMLEQLVDKTKEESQSNSKVLNQKIDDQRGQLSQLQQKLALKEAQLKAKEDSAGMLEQLVGKTKEESQVTIAQLNAKIDDQRSQLNQLRQELALAKAAPQPEVIKPKPVVVTKEVIKEVIVNRPDEAALKKSQEEVVKANEQVIELSTKLLAKEHELAQMKSEISLKDKQTQGSAEDLARLTRQVETLKGELNRKITDYQYKDMEVKRLKQQQAGKDKEYTDKIAALSSQLSQMEKKIATAVSPEERRALKEQLANSQKEIESLRNALGVKTDEILNLRRQIQQFVEKTKKVPQEAPKAVKPDETRALKEQLARSQKEIESLRKALGLKTDEIFDLNRKIRKSTASQEVKGYQETLAQVKAHAKELQARLDEAISKQDRGDLKKALRDAQIKIKASEEEAQQQRSQSQGLQNQVAQLQAQLKTAQEKLDQAKAKPVVDVKILDQYKTQVNDLKDALAQAQVRLKAAEGMSVQFEKARQELSQTKRLLDENNSQLDKMRQKQESQAQEREALMKDIKAYQAKVSRLNEDIIKLKSMASQDNGAQLLAQIKVKDKHIETLEREVKAKTGSYLSQQNEIDSLRAQMKASQGRVVELTKKLEKYVSIIEELGLGNEGYLVRDGKNTALLLRDVNTRIKKIQEELTTTISEREDLRASYNDLQAQLNEARAMVQACMSKILIGGQRPF